MEYLNAAEGYTPLSKKKLVYKWKIEEFLSLISFYSNRQNAKSLQSNCPNDFKWRLQLDFNTIHSGRQDWISMSVQYIGASNAIKSKCSLYILDNKSEKKFTQKIRRLFNPNEAWNIFQFLEIKKLLEKKDKLLPNNDLIIGIKVTEFNETVHKQIVVPAKSLKHRIINDLEDLFESKAGSDVILLVGDERIAAHKLILTIRSPVFAAMFLHQLEENKKNEITIPDMDPEVCEKLLEYIYTDNVNGLDDIAELLYEEADKYHIADLKELCEEAFCRGVEVGNAVKYLALLERHHADEKFFDYVLNFIALNSKEIAKTADYKALGKVNQELFLTIVTMICSTN